MGFPCRPLVRPASFKHVGQALYSLCQKFGENGPVKIWSIFRSRSTVGNLIQNFSLFNTRPKRPWASPASLKHVGQALYSSGFKFGKNGPNKIFVHFCLQVSSGGISLIFLVFPTHSLKATGPPLQVSSM